MACKSKIEAWVDQLAESQQILPMDSRCFREWARLMEGRPEGIMEDAMIAATARVHALVVATRNQRDFRNLAVEFVNPFKVRDSSARSKQYARQHCGWLALLRPVAYDDYID